MLVYVDDFTSGISRRKARHGWSYWHADGTRVTDREEIERLHGIGLPPAYVDAWYSTDPNAHLQATGRDARGRKQYRYHPEFTRTRDKAKFGQCAEFGDGLSRLRARVERDLRRRGMPRDKALAAVVRLLDASGIRIGNEVYARDNRSFGATTLRSRHAKVNGKRLELRFVAKSGKQRMIELSDAPLARAVRRCQDLPGQHLFSYVADDGTINHVGSADVNEYIRETTGGDFTAKLFRTWTASVLAFEALTMVPEQRPTTKALLEPVAAALGNTVAIARKSYVHPVLLAMAADGPLATHPFPPKKRATRYLTGNERRLITLLCDPPRIPPRNARGRASKG